MLPRRPSSGAGFLPLSLNGGQTRSGRLKSHVIHRNAYKRWDQAQEALLRQLLTESLPLQEISRRLGRKTSAIRKRIIKLGFETPDALEGGARSIGALDGSQLLLYLKDASRELPPRSYRVLSMRLGLDGEKPLSLQQVGERMHISRERVRQLEKKALGQVRRLGAQQRFTNVSTAPARLVQYAIEVVNFSRAGSQGSLPDDSTARFLLLYFSGSSWAKAKATAPSFQAQSPQSRT